MTYIQSRKLKYFGRIFSIVLLAGVTTLWFISHYQHIYAENMSELEELNQMEVQALQTQYLFKKQVQEWKNILLRGQSIKDFEKYLGLFKQEFAATQASAQRLYETIAPNSPTKDLTEKFKIAHREMLVNYAAALEIYNAYEFDAQKSDAEVRGIDREATDTLDQVVNILNEEIEQKREAILTKLSLYIYLFGIGFLFLQFLFCWLAIRLTAALLKSGLTDKTTQLGNRELFVNTIADAVQKSQSASIAIFDINNFKIINEAFGNNGGDHYMRLLAKKIKKRLSKDETLCRIGGDMLGLIIHCKDTNEAIIRVNKIKDIIANFEYKQENIQMSLTASAGIFCMHSSSASNNQQILNNLYASLQEAKSLGRNRVVLYSSDSVEIKQRREQMQKVHEINKALEEKRIVLFCQQVHDLSRENPKHYYEVLMRVKDEDGNYQPPGSFLAAAERFSMMESIDRYIINCLVDHLLLNPEDSDSYAVNLSGSTLSDKTFIQFIHTLFENKDLAHHRISFEITETDIVKNFKTASHIIKTLKDYGCKVSLDDFGTGMSSYSYLSELDIDTVKIDGCFIKELDKKANNQAIVRSIVSLSQDLEIKVVAEFVETQAELDTIRALGINYAQGYLLHKPEFLFQPNQSVLKKAS